MEKEYNNLSHRLKLSLKILGISQTELAKRIRVKPQIIQYLCAGNSDKTKFMFDIAEALKIDVSWLATGRGIAPSNSNNDKNERTIPLLTFDQIKEKVIKAKEVNPAQISSWIPVKDDISTDSFAVILNDKSMAPRFDLNTIIIIDPTPNALKAQPNNMFALVYLAEENFIVFRQLDIANDIKTLTPINTSLYKNVSLTDKDIICGFCKEARWSA